MMGTVCVVGLVGCLWVFFSHYCGLSMASVFALWRCSTSYDLFLH